VSAIALVLFISLFSLSPSSQPTVEPIESSLCLAFVDYDFIWTLETVRSGSSVTPILNGVCLSAGEWELSPDQIRLLDDQGRELSVQEFSLDSGDPANPFLSTYVKLRGGDAMGVDLVGDFSTVDSLKQMSIEIGKDRFILYPMDCNEFEVLLDKVSRLEFGSSNLVTAYQTLNLRLFGEREAR
jgi:hypothetical protein